MAQQQQQGVAMAMMSRNPSYYSGEADLGMLPLYVYSSTFNCGGIRHTDDLLGVLSLIVYNFLLFTIINYMYIGLRANDDSDDGTFALYSLIREWRRMAEALMRAERTAEAGLGREIFSRRTGGAALGWRGCVGDAWGRNFGGERREGSSGGGLVC
uniref:K+ potassium transporter integral membrane domain-containing protein n=1 Tax=Oryza brachyantha TaxID=4533 RepID=J3L8A9_ORYBR